MVNGDAIHQVRRESERKKAEEEMVFTISRGWRRLARIGTVASLGSKHPNITNCETGKALAGLGVVDGIIFVANPSKLSGLDRVQKLCVGEAGAVLEMVDTTATCSTQAWCAQLETEAKCSTACHAVTGTIVTM